MPPAAATQKWREIEGKKYYMPGEVCDPIGKDWFWVAGDKPRSDEALLKQFHACRAGGVNLLLDVPPDKHGADSRRNGGRPDATAKERGHLNRVLE